MASATPARPPRPDRRWIRHEATKQEIVDAAWRMVRSDGLNGLSLRGLARSVDMEPQSLYTYFDSKHAVYDRLFVEANRQLLARFERIEISDDPRPALAAVARLFVAFACEDRARYELLFLRTIPDFEPSPESYAMAIRVFAEGRRVLTAAGIGDDADFDLWTAIVSGLCSQQLANDPGGDRYLRLIDEAVAMFADHVFAKVEAKGVGKA